MKKLLSSLALASLLFSSTLNASALEAEVQPGPLYSKEEVQKQMGLEKEKQVQYHVQEYSSLNSSQRQMYLQEYDLVDSSLNKNSLIQEDETTIKEIFSDKLENAYIFTMDEHGYIYDKQGDVIDKLDLLSESDSNVAPMDAEIIPAAAGLDSSINGYNTGAFVRQTTSPGYKGIRTTFVLPTDKYYETPDSVTGYLYNGLDVLSSDADFNKGNGFKVEAGLQYGEANDDYAASIRPLGAGQNFVPEGYTGAAPRYKAGTSIVSNLLYDTSSSQVKYFVDGTNVNNKSQYIYFYYTKVLTAKEQAALCVKRNTALAKTGWTGTKIGSVQVTYTSTSVTKLNGTTTNLTSSMLSTHRYNGKTFGTADNPSVGITKTGNLDTQKIIINTTGY